MRRLAERAPCSVHQERESVPGRGRNFVLADWESDLDGIEGTRLLSHVRCSGPIPISGQVRHDAPPPFTGNGSTWAAIFNSIQFSRPIPNNLALKYFVYFHAVLPSSAPARFTTTTSASSVIPP
jgi:hypothetical protein